MTLKNFWAKIKTGLLFLAEHFEETFLFVIYGALIIAPDKAKVTFIPIAYFWIATAIMRANWAKKRMLETTQIIGVMNDVLRDLYGRIRELEKEPWQREP